MFNSVGPKQAQIINSPPPYLTGDIYVKMFYLKFYSFPFYFGPICLTDIFTEVLGIC